MRACVAQEWVQALCAAPLPRCPASYGWPNLSGDAIVRAIMLSHSGAAPPPDKRVTMVMLDGARPDIFDRLVAAGDLPTISRHVLEPGGRVPATTVFPSTTGIAYLPFLTGCYPGTCQVPGTRWMDVARYQGRWIRDREHVRSYCGYQGGMLNSDVPETVLSIFDIEEDSTAICSPFTRGLGEGRHRCSVSRMVYGAAAHYNCRYEPLDRTVCQEMVVQAGRHPRFMFAVLPGIDGVAHLRYPDHPRVLDLYREFDRDLGRYLAAVGTETDHLLMLVSDHGFSRIDRHVDIALALEDLGIATLRHPVLWRRHPKAAVMVSGNASAQIYLAPGTPRPYRYSLSAIEGGEIEGIPKDLVDHLASLQAVAFVAAVEGEDVVVVSASGRARITMKESTIGYAPETSDVLGYGPTPQRHDLDGWLRATIDSPHPDGPVQLLQLFSSQRTGDLIVSAVPGADLRSDWEVPEHKAGHGSLAADQMLCLAAINRPVAGPIRAVDAFPMVLHYLGHDIPSGIDGRLRSASPAVAPEEVTVTGATS